MSDEAKVLASKDDGEKQQWGRNWLYFRDGVKWTVRTKVLAALVGLVFIASCLIQTAVDDSGSRVSAKPKEGIPLDAAAQSNVPVEQYTEKGATNVKKRSGNKGFASRKLTGPQVIARPRNVKIPPGAMISARLVSGASNGLVRAELTDTLSSDGETLLEDGTVLVGQGSSNEERLMVSFTQAVFRDGTIASIQAQACDQSDKIVGLKGSKLGNKAINIAGSIGLGFVGGLSDGLQDTQGQQGVAIRPPSLKNALLNATATTALEQSKNLMSDLKEQRPVIEVPAGQPICVIFDVNRQ